MADTRDDPKWSKVRDKARELFGKDVIWRFRGDHFFLSNMYVADSLSIELDGLRYLSTEHAFVATKTMDIGEREEICATLDPKDAKRFGRKFQLRDDWLDINCDVMQAVLRKKFSHEDLAQQLLATGTRHLVEGNLWHDRFWGMAMHDGQLEGENRLGELLMQVRDDLARNGLAECNKKWDAELKEVAWMGPTGTAPTEVQADADYGLNPNFAAWLRAAVSQEAPTADVESILVGVGVILSGADLDEEALCSAAQVVRDEGAPHCADALPAEWKSWF